jgi:hypothetical protein
VNILEVAMREAESRVKFSVKHQKQPQSDDQWTYTGTLTSVV